MFFGSREECLSFYRLCQNYARRARYRRELSEEFPAWAFLHWAPTRSRVDLLFIDFLRMELGAKESVRQKALKEAVALDAEAANYASGEADVAVAARQEGSFFVSECMDGVVGRDRDILAMHVLGDMSLTEVASELGISKTRVRQRFEAVKARLRGRGSLSSIEAKEPAGSCHQAV